MKLVAGVLFGVLAACASSSTTKSAAPAQPQPQMPSMAERSALSMKLYARMVFVFESAGGDCDVLAARIAEYSATDEAAAARILTNDEEFRAYERAHHEETRATYEPLATRLFAAIGECAGDERVTSALAATGLFKVRMVTTPMPAQAAAE